LTDSILKIIRKIHALRDLVHEDFEEKGEF